MYLCQDLETKEQVFKNKNYVIMYLCQDLETKEQVFKNKIMSLCTYVKI